MCPRAAKLGEPTSGGACTASSTTSTRKDLYFELFSSGGVATRRSHNGQLDPDKRTLLVRTTLGWNSPLISEGSFNVVFIKEQWSQLRHSTSKPKTQCSLISVHFIEIRTRIRGYQLSPRIGLRGPHSYIDWPALAGR